MPMAPMCCNCCQTPVDSVVISRRWFPRAWRRGNTPRSTPTPVTSASFPNHQRMPWPSLGWPVAGGRCGGGVGGCGRRQLWLPERAISIDDSLTGLGIARCSACCLLMPARHATQFTPGSRMTLRTRPPSLLTDWRRPGLGKVLGWRRFWRPAAGDWPSRRPWSRLSP